ncbi:MAG: hypothetical protein U1F37_05670 [Alphaproteobacteria bacterium]|nr:hypothetical protein [Candidatus Odyssella sp.]
MANPSDDGVLRGVDIVLSQYEVCCYALVVSLTAISLSEAEQRARRLALFNAALDDFERGLFDLALGRARAAAAPDFLADSDAVLHDYEALRARLHQILARRPGRA